jgi:uncharacterized protein (DUF58 family)
MLSPAPRLLWIFFLLAVPVCTLAGANAAAWPFAVIFLTVLALVFAWDAHQLGRALEDVRASAETPVSCYKDRTASFTVELRLPALLRGVDAALDLPASFAQDEPVAQTATSGTVQFRVTPECRGEFAVRRLFVSAPSAWGLWRMRSEKTVSLLVKVFPDLSKDPASRKLFSSLQQGQRVQRLIGRGREVERLREYAPGDSFDEVYWKATARRGAPVTKVFQVERTQDIYAIVDGSRLGNRNQALERFVTASLLLALAAEKNSDHFGLLTFTDKVGQFVRAAHGKGHFHRCREAIFALQPASVSPDFGELFSFINLRIRKRSLLFFLTDLSDPLLAETFLRDAVIVTRRHIVMVDQIADAGDRRLFNGVLPVSEGDVQTRLAGHLQWAKLRELEKSLGHIGVQMQLLKPERASVELIGQYKTIKQRQLL